MSWTSPLTAVANAAFTAAQFNASVRDNLNVTPAALATTAGAIFAATGANAIAQRIPSTNTIPTSNTTTSTSFVDLGTAGPSVTVTTGTNAIVMITASVNNSSSGGDNRVDFVISGSTARSPSDSTALIHQTAVANQSHRAASVNMLTTLVAGSNTFKAQYRITAAGGGTATFNDRTMVVIPL